MPVKYYEQWTLSELQNFANLSAEAVIQIFNDCGEYIEEFKIRDLTFERFIVINDHIQAIYNGDCKSKINGAVWEEDWLNCDIFVWKHDGKWLAQFGGTPNHPADNDETFAARHGL